MGAHVLCVHSTISNVLQRGDFPKQFKQQSLKLWTAQRGKDGWRRHLTQRVQAGESTQGKNGELPTLLPILRATPIRR